MCMDLETSSRGHDAAADDRTPSQDASARALPEDWEAGTGLVRGVMLGMLCWVVLLGLFWAGFHEGAGNATMVSNATEQTN